MPCSGSPGKSFPQESDRFFQSGSYIVYVFVVILDKFLVKGYVRWHIAFTQPNG
jgi:hypothetical protein